jgi:glycosyltransferase involved in cell wall biosynthesis
LEVALATMGAPLRREQRRDAAREPGLEIHESAFRLEWMSDPWDDVRRAGDWLLELEERAAPDVVHLNQYCFGSLPFRAPVLMTGHSCVLSWWRAVRGGDPPAEWSVYAREVRRGLAGAALVTAPTQAMLDALELRYGPLGAACVIPNGRSLPAGDERRKEPLFLTAGRIWDDAKNLRALEAIAGDLPWPAYVAGENRSPEGGVREYSHCHFLGALNPEEMADWMRRASVYVLPARYEPFGLSILEAALAGCALVLGDIPSLRELWDGAAAFVSPASPGALAHALRRMAGSVEERTSLAARAQQRARQFTPGRMAAAYADAYRAAAGRPADLGSNADRSGAFQTARSFPLGD